MTTHKACVGRGVVVSRNAIKVRLGIKWSAAEQRKILETMMRVLVDDARAEVARHGSVSRGSRQGVSGA